MEEIREAETTGQVYCSIARWLKEFLQTVESSADQLVEGGIAGTEKRPAKEKKKAQNLL